MLIGLAFVIGLIFGSFATVAAYRIPRRETIVSGRSHCPSCGRMIRAVENVPVLSYLALGGRCRGCKARISPRYPAIELVTGILFAVAAWRFGPTLTALIFAMFFWTLVVLTVIDLDHKLLPNRVVFPLAIAGAVGLTASALVHDEPNRLLDALVGAAIFGGFFFLIAMIVPAGMGGGDVKLAFVLGMFLGYAGGPGFVLVGMFLSFLTGGLLGIALILFAGKGRKAQVPFGPFLATGSVAAVAFARPLLDLYLGSV